MDRYFPVHFKNIRVQHHHLSNGNLVSHNVTVLIFSTLLVERSYKHYGTSFGICRYLDLTVLVSHITVLSEFVELDIFFSIIHILDVLFDFFLVISNIIFENEVDESMTHWSLCQDKLKFSVGIQFYQNLVNWICWKWVLFLTGVTLVLSDHCRFVDV